MSDKHIDDVSGTETTGHEWDGIRELNTPLPRWWLWTFYATVIWAIGYTIAFPAWPMISSATSGILGYSSRAQLADQVSALDAARADVYARLDQMQVADIVADDDLARFARAGGASLFKVNCSQCHGSGAQGAAGYPNLNDDEWIWGGTVDEIYTTIAHGVRFDDDSDTRFNEMPAFGAGILSPGEIRAVAAYVAKLPRDRTDAQSAQDGRRIFADACAGCHADDGAGKPELGAPALNDAIWLYSHDLDAIVAQIRDPRHGVMPAWRDKLGDTAVKQLAVYVHGLGGGQ